MQYDTFNPREYETHWWALKLVEPNSKVLDLGCATGYLARELKKKGCLVFGIEKDIAAAKMARQHCQKVIIADLEKPQKISLPPKHFNYVLLLDILEHLCNREQLLKQIRQWLAPTGKLIISTPNIAHVSIRLNLLAGKFVYQDYGILDRSHVHFFTKETLLALLNQLNYQVEQILPSADFGQLPFVNRLARRLPKLLQFRLAQLLPELLGVQFIAICRNEK